MAPLTVDQQDIALQLVALVDCGQCTLAELVTNDTETAILVGSWFCCQRDGLDWLTVDLETRILQFELELWRETRGDYSNGEPPETDGEGDEGADAEAGPYVH